MWLSCKHNGHDYRSMGGFYAGMQPLWRIRCDKLALLGEAVLSCRSFQRHSPGSAMLATFRFQLLNADSDACFDFCSNGGVE